VCAIISPLAVPGSYLDKYCHYRVLRTLADGFRLPGCPGSTNEVAPIASIWRPPPADKPATLHCIHWNPSRLHDYNLRHGSSGD
jgi:hypothetical protein